ncbi:MAG: site-specific DNA-methyltransferase [Prevotella sp.]|jgi:adenine-specific DNA-methyltransferase|nr:site-specific DNA-methyltransferase [Prevotella sp.]MCH3993490.1 site-specific DNA-methyltransferase [Prevotella sp.]
MDKYELVKKLKVLHGLTDDEKSTLIGLLRSHKKYGLVWEDKPEYIETELEEKLPTLTEVKDRAIINDKAKEHNPNHIIIEGDNLHALTTLCYTHSGRIDVIYIDPPYNTGNKDFVYNDNYVDSEDAYRHSKWLSFMVKRLRIAKKLLSDKGVIFISIDDNEQANLKLLCDEIFGEKNFVAKFDWRKKTGANDAKDIAVITESVLLYAKDKNLAIEFEIWNRDVNSRNHKRFRYSDEFVKTRGKYYLDTLDRGGLQYSDSLNYGIQAPDGGMIYPNGRSKYVNDGWIWKWSRDKIKWGIENKFLEFVKSKKSKDSKYTIKYKVYENVDNEGNIREKTGRAFSNLILDFINQQGNSDLSDVFGGRRPFSNPKPIGLIEYLINTLYSKQITILDFFAGSGTTLHATMQLNARDGGHRQCILVTNNENNICENVTYERNKRVINGYTTPKGKKVEGLHDNNLRYYKTDFVERDRTIKNMRALVTAATDMICIKENLYKEDVRFGSCNKLPKKVARHFADDTREMLIIYKEEYIPTIVDFISKMVFNLPLKVYVFSPDRDPFEEEFKDVMDKVELCALPAAIYDAYVQVLPKQKDKPIEIFPESNEDYKEDEWAINEEDEE